jgi:ATP-dependent Clp protease protease subunit
VKLKKKLNKALNKLGMGLKNEVSRVLNGARDFLTQTSIGRIISVTGMVAVPLVIGILVIGLPVDTNNNQLETPKKDIEVSPIYPAPSLDNSSATNFTIPGNRVVIIGGEIRDNMRSVARRIAELALESAEPIYLLLNSPGGSVLDGSLVIQAIEASRAPVHTVCIQICASMAAMIFEYGSKRLIGDKATLMFHPASGSAEGELDKMVSRLSHFQKFIGTIEAQIAKRIGMSFEHYKAESGMEIWVQDQDAVDRKYADQVVRIQGVVPYSKALDLRGTTQDSIKRPRNTETKINIRQGN